MSNSQLTFGNGTALCREHNAGFVEAACPYCEIDRLKEEVKELKERIAIKDDVICASKLVIEEYERKLKQLRTETSMSVIKDTITDMLK